MKSLSPAKQLFASLATYVLLLLLSLTAASLFPAYRLPILLASDPRLPDRLGAARRHP